MKKILIAGTNSGVGKTTISLGLMRALKNRGLKIQPFKVGPDYIDPMYHRYVTGKTSRNIDSYMLDDEQIKYVFNNAAKDSDISIVEGVMGLFDGIGGSINKCSTAYMAKVLKSPVILVINGKAMAGSAAALVLGYKSLDLDIDIVGVIINNVKTEKHFNIIRASIEKYCGIEVLGYLPPDEEIEFESRHLGLIPSEEVRNIDTKVEKLSQSIEKYIDVERIIEISESETLNSSFELSMFYEDQDVRKLASGRVIAIAYDEAFNFYYQDNIELLEKAGVKVVFFSPLRDEKVPEADLIYLGGGFPEIFASRLEKNESMRKDLKRLSEQNKPIYAECGGLMYLGEYILDQNGDRYEMVSAISGYSEFTKKTRRFGYCSATAKEDNLIALKGEIICGHEFHKSEFISDEKTVFDVEKAVEGRSIESWHGGYSVRKTLGTYLHTHFYNNLGVVYNLLSSMKDR